ncbi:Shedu anti-phage system protein SduA domain-containing protein [Actinomadura sp. NPDC048955]|uniref:Shedu anti-phage system protein SduA domain-containing protein n=1 Tax=Actinomadura sp. NPDC048955 TaxID=3158228 RepID=UPI0033ED4A0B
MSDNEDELLTSNNSLKARPIKDVFEERRANDPLRDFYVPWDDIRQGEISAFEQILESSESERPLQRWLQDHPIFLVQHLGGGHGRWVIPQKRLGAEFIPDFVTLERFSAGFSWTLVELQSPKVKFFTNVRRPSEQLDEGIRQILEWRRWLSANRDYARRDRTQHGLGLSDIDDKATGLLIIGREQDLSTADSEQIRQLGYDHRIEIHTYDWLTREAKRRLEELERSFRRLRNRQDESI